MTVVLDADVLIAALDASDVHHPQAQALFTVWHELDVKCCISVVNLSEVLVAPAMDDQRLRAAREAISLLGISVHHPGELLGVDAARFRGRHPISLPGAYCLATARHTKSQLVSFDRKVARAARAEGIIVRTTGDPEPQRAW